MAALHAELEHAVGGIALRVALDVAAGRCLALAGPSGAGKTTVLRLLAGTARPNHGLVMHGDQVWVDTTRGVWLEPERRRCGYVFQDYALFPHLSAWRNVAYGLRSPRSRAARKAAAISLLEQFGLGHRADARPSMLSGGERQRVALARALAPAPQILLLDEPLSALDSRARATAGRELTTALRTLELPVVLVTHDFTEAAVMGDEVAVVDRGVIVQRGTPSELATAPASAFVADFTGAVVLTGTVTRAGGGGGLTAVELDGGGTAVSTDPGEGRVGLSVYPWEITIAASAGPRHESAQNQLTVRITSVTTVGNRVRLGLAGAQSLVAEVTGRAVDELDLAVGREVTATWKATATRLVEL